MTPKRSFFKEVMLISGFLILLTDVFSSSLYAGDWDYAKVILLTD